MKTKNIILIALLVLLTGLASCQKDHDIPVNKVYNGNNYTITAVSSPESGGITSGSGTYQKGQACTVTATAEAGYTFVNWTENGNLVSNEASYTFTVAGNRTLVANFILCDYSNIILNEINGNDKFIEIYNSGTVAINLNGVYMEKDGIQNWVADNTVRIEAGEYLLLYSEDVQIDHPDCPESMIIHSGISAKKNVRFQLFTSTGVSVDDFNLTNIDLNGEAYGYVSNAAPASYSRNVDGNWYYAEATPGAANVDGVNIVLGLEGGCTPEPPTPEEPDYTNLVLNELNGDTKFIEIYNKGDMDLSLEGMYIMKDDYVAGAIWTANATIVAPAGGYVLLYSEDVTPDHPEHPEALIFHSGLSSKKTIRVTLFMPDGTEVDSFTRGTTGEWGQTISNVAPQSYARTPNGGDWKLANPTPGEANPDTGEIIPQE